jgi:hypothetical protein
MTAIKTFASSSDLLKDWDSGQGKTNELADIASLENNQLSYNGYSVEVTPVWQAAALVMYLHKELKTKPENKQKAMLDIFAQNRLSDNHKFDDGTGAKPALAKPLPNHYLSSDKQRSNYFALVEADTIASIYHLLADANSSTTKDSLLALIKSAKELIITESQAESLAILEAKEGALIEARTKLEEIGCVDVKFTSETSLTAIASYDVAGVLIKTKLEGLAYNRENDKLLGGAEILVSFELENVND